MLRRVCGSRSSAAPNWRVTAMRCHSKSFPSQSSRIVEQWSRFDTPAFELVARGIGKTFPGVRALDGVDFSVAAGEFHAVLGENGAGKSTLMNILSGVFPPDTGSIEINGEPVSLSDPRAAQAIGHRDDSPGAQPDSRLVDRGEPVPRARVPPRGSASSITDGSMRESMNLLGQLDLHHLDPGTPVERLRVGQQQMVEIAKALSFDSQCDDHGRTDVRDQRVRGRCALQAD